jgi:hypothetical protein
MRFDLEASPLNGMRCSVVTSICVSPIDTTQLLNPLSWVVAVLPSSQVTVRILEKPEAVLRDRVFGNHAVAKPAIGIDM